MDFVGAVTQNLLGVVALTNRTEPFRCLSSEFYPHLRWRGLLAGSRGHRPSPVQASPRHDDRPTADEGVDHAPLARSRSANFWILPVEVLGMSAKTT